MSWQKNYLTLGLVGVLLLSATADNGVHILSKYGQLVTSSTLNWLPAAHYHPSREIVVGGFLIVHPTEDDSENNQAEKPEAKRTALFVCRAQHDGIWVAGSQKNGEKRCTVSIHGNVHSYEKYELLENVESAARVRWVYWNKYEQIPGGAVAVTDKMYVARRVHSNHSEPVRYTHYIGTIDSNDNLGTIFYVDDSGVEGSDKRGEVLAETEPTHYELSNVKLNWPKKRVVNRVPRILGEATIKNTGSEAASMAEAFGFSYNYKVYWGQIHATLKGQNTSITLSNGTLLSNIMWGLEQKLNRTDVHTVQIYLEPGTAVNVTLKANYTEMDVPYSGKLISKYEDAVTKVRVIAGTRREKSMFDITPEFGPIFFLNNHSLVPTTMPPPTTEPTVTTVLPANKETHQRDDMEEVPQDENLIVIPPKKSDTSNMQSDDGGPLSLKNKVETGGQSGANNGPTRLSLTILSPLLAIIVHRIT